MRTVKSLDSQRIRTPSDALFYSAGIPSTHWATSPGTYAYRPFKFAEDKPMITSELQVKFATKLLTEPDIFKAPELVYVCVREHEALGLGLTFDIVKHALACVHRVQIDNAAWEYEPDRNMPVAVLVNVSDTTTYDRRQRVRDWIHDYDASFRVVCGVAEPMNLVAYTDIRPTMVFYVNANAVVAR